MVQEHNVHVYTSGFLYYIVRRFSGMVVDDSVGLLFVVAIARNKDCGGARQVNAFVRSWPFLGVPCRG